MRSTAVRGLIASFLLCLALIAAPAANAQSLSAGVVETWIDGLLAEIRSSGATRAERGAVTADGSGGFTVAGVTVGLPSGVEVRVARLVGEGARTGARFQAQRLRAEGFAVNADVIRVEVPRMELETLDLPSLTPAAFFGRSDAGLVATIRELNLARWSMPALTVRGGQGPTAIEASMRDVVIEDVQRGVARRMSYGPTEFSAREGTTNVTGTFGAITAEGVDFAVNASVLAPAPGDSRELRLAYARATFAGGNMDLGQGVRITLGRMEVVNARVRTPRTGYLEFLRFTLEAQQRPNNTDPEQLRRLANMVQDYFDLSEVERMTLGETTVVTPQGNFTLGGFEGQQIASARFGRLAFSDVEFESPQANVSVGSFVLSEVDYTEALKVMLEATASGQIAPNPALLEGRLPRVGGIELRDVSVEAQNQGELSLDSATFAMGQWRGFVPDLLRLTVGEFSIPSALIEASGTVQRPTPTDLGYESIDVGGEIQIRIDEQARTARLSPGRIAIDDFGGISLEMTLGDVDTGRLGLAGLQDPLPLLQQTTFRELRLRIENSGFIDRYAGWVEREQRVPAAQLRAQITQGLAPLVELFIQDPAQKERARAAVQAFGREQLALTLVITPRARMTLFDIMAAAQGGGPPLQLLGQVNLELTAND